MLPKPGSPTHFSKYQATGNDFILLPWNSIALPPETTIRAFCHRRTGIGADGLLLLLPPTQTTLNPTMVLFNPDGSRPEMCGNGLRCAALHLATQKALPAAHPFTIQTDAGPRNCTIIERTPTSATIRIDMGTLTPPQPLTLQDPPLQVLRVSVGNPHIVLLDSAPNQVPTLGPILSSHPRFPEGVNVGFATNISPTAIDLTVWERGAGLTLACGTGACAAVAAAWSAHRLATSTNIEVRLPGGTLVVDLNPQTNQAYLSGNASLVFTGDFPWPAP